MSEMSRDVESALLSKLYKRLATGDLLKVASRLGLVRSQDEVRSGLYRIVNNWGDIETYEKHSARSYAKGLIEAYLERNKYAYEYLSEYV